jgi:hypothetical protein
MSKRLIEHFDAIHGSYVIRDLIEVNGLNASIRLDQAYSESCQSDQEKVAVATTRCLRRLRANCDLGLPRRTYCRRTSYDYPQQQRIGFNQDFFTLT